MRFCPRDITDHLVCWTKQTIQLLLTQMTDELTAPVSSHHSPISPHAHNFRHLLSASRTPQPSTHLFNRESGTFRTREQVVS